MNDELKRAISIARIAHDRNDGPADATAVSIGALINAVEILADQLKDEHVGTYHPPTIAEIKTQDDPEGGAHDPAPNATPAPNLVERLKKAYVFAKMEAVAGGGDPVDMGVRAILTSLSKTPVAMMTADHIATLCGGEDYSPTDRRYARVAVQAFKEFIAPILAAKDARIEKLEALYAAAKVTDPERIETIELQRKRIVELEKQRDDERGLSNLRSFEIDTWKKELAEAREMIADLERRREAEAEFPTDDDIANRVDTPNDCCIESVLQAIAVCREHHAAVVAAKDAKIAELETSHSATVEAMQAALNMAKRDYMAAQTALDNVKDKLQRTEQDLGAKNDRIAELEKQLATGANDIELPTNQECADAYEYHFKLSSASGMNRPGGPSFFELQRAGMGGVISLVREKLGPAMAVKKLQLVETQQRVAELEREQRACVEALSASLLVMPGRTLIEAVKDLVELHGTAKKKFDELEKEVAQQQGVIRLQNKTMEDHVSRGVHESMVADLRATVDGLEKRLAELTAPVTVDGKTPGQVDYEGYFSETPDDVTPWPNLSPVKRNKHERAAQAVLRAFGQPSQTAQTNTVEALRDCLERVRRKLCEKPTYDYTFGQAQVRIGLVHDVFDAEIAKLEAKPASNAATPKFFVNENELRGSYFCTQFPFRPYLHVGRDVEFDDIPRILKLGRNDIIEVRVVHREPAKTA